jgi:hypothetical protein
LLTTYRVVQLVSLGPRGGEPGRKALNPRDFADGPRIRCGNSSGGAGSRCEDRFVMPAVSARRSCCRRRLGVAGRPSLVTQPHDASGIAACAAESRERPALPLSVTGEGQTLLPTDGIKPPVISCRGFGGHRGEPLPCELGQSLARIGSDVPVVRLAQEGGRGERRTDGMAVSILLLMVCALR